MIERRHLGIVPDELLDDEAKVAAWVAEQHNGVQLAVLTPTRTYAPGRTRRKLIDVTICEAIISGKRKQTPPVVYRPEGIADWEPPIAGGK